MRVIFTLVSVLPPNTPTGAEVAVLTGAAAAATLGAAAAGLGAFAGAVLTCAGCEGEGTGATAAFVDGATAATAGVAAATSLSTGMMTKRGSPTLISSPSDEKVSMIRPAKGLRTSTVTYRYSK